MPPDSNGAGKDEELFRVFIQSVTDYAIFTLDVDGRVMSWNAGARRLKGYEAAEIIGQHFSRFYFDEDIAAGKPDQNLAIAVAEGHLEEEGWRLRNDGSAFWANVVITALRGPDGRLLGFGKVTRDLTERMQAEHALRESEERFRLLVDSVSDYAIFLLTTDGHVATWNRGAQRLKGYRPDEIIGSSFERFYTAEDRRDGVPARGLKEALRVGRFETEGWRVRRDGTRFWANVVITALHDADENHRGFAKVTRDLTARKRTEDALRGILERERMAAAQLREVDHMRSELMSIVAHDVRGPIGVLQGFSELLLGEWATMPDDEKRAVVERLAARSRQLGDFVNDVFDASRLETGDLQPDVAAIDLAEIAAGVVADTMALLPDRIVTLHVADSLPVGWADGHRTWQIMSNLVSNAVKFSPSDSEVAVRIGVDDDDENMLAVAVSDRGPGIPPEQRHLLFQRFTRLPDARGVAGSGMGLFIARSLTEAQGGRIWVDTSPGGGATFSFTIPIAPTTPS